MSTEANRHLIPDQPDSQMLPTWLRQALPLTYRITSYLALTMLDDPAWLAMAFC